MTENEWPQEGTLGAPTTTQQTPTRQASTYPSASTGGTSAASSEGAASKTDAAKQEAAEVGRQATDSAQHVAETAKTEAAHVAAEVKTNARDLLYQAKSDLTDQAGAQQQKVAEGLHSISTQLHTMASASDQPGVASDIVRQAAEKSSAVASWLEGRDPGSLVTEVKSFARQRPGTFLLLAAGAGVLAGRLSRSLSAGAPDAATPAATTSTPVSRIPDTGMPVPPPPVQLPAQETTTAGYGQTYPPNPLDPRQPIDPLRDDPFDGDRR